MVGTPGDQNVVRHPLSIELRLQVVLLHPVLQSSSGSPLNTSGDGSDIPAVFRQWTERPFNGLTARIVPLTREVYLAALGSPRSTVRSRPTSPRKAAPRARVRAVLRTWSA